MKIRIQVDSEGRKVLENVCNAALLGGGLKCLSGVSLLLTSTTDFIEPKLTAENMGAGQKEPKK